MTGAGSRLEGLSERLAAVSPIRPDLAAALAHFEHLALADLQHALRRHEDSLRAWASDPANRERASAASPGYLDRVALGTLIEYRTLGGLSAGVTVEGGRRGCAWSPRSEWRGAWWPARRSPRSSHAR